MSTARDAGLAALQSGDIETAIAQLEAAVQENPSDFDACLYLGGAYGQAGRPLDAIKSVTQAVQIEPANAQARYNLGVAMEQGGYAEQALQVYNQALHLQPDYPNAKEAVARLHASSNQGFGAPVSGGASATGSGQQFQEMQPQPAAQPTQQFAQPAAFGQQPAAQQPSQQFAQPAAFGQQPQQPYNPLAPPPQSDQTTQAFTPPAQQSPAFARPASPVGQPQQPAEAGLGSYMAPPPPAARAPGGYGAPAAYGARPGAYSSVPSYDDEFKMGQAFKDFFRALFTPRVLFSEMAGCETSKSAWALFVWYSVFMLVLAGINGAMRMSSPSVASQVVAPAFVTSPAFAFVMSLVSIPFYLIVWVIFAGIIQMLSRAFGSSLRYGASIRCVIYSAAPFLALMFILTIVGVVMRPQMENSLLASGGTGATGNYQSGTMTGGIGTKQSSKKSGHTNKSGSSSNSSSGSSTGTFGSGSGNSSPFGATSSQYGRAGSSAGNPFGASGSPYGSGSMPYGTSPSNPFGPLQAMAGYFLVMGGIFVFAAVWGVGLLGVAVSNVHEISGGAGAGVAILSAIITGVLGVIAYVLFAVAIVAAVMSSMPH